MKAFFRLLASLFKQESGAQSVAGVSALALVLYTGFTIPQPTMIGALRWITYINVSCYFISPFSLNLMRDLRFLAVEIWLREYHR